MISMKREFRISLVLIAINAVCFAYTFFAPSLKQAMMLVKPIALTGDYWRFVTSMFAHSDIIHLAMNMACLYFFGQMTEYFFGKAKFVAIYFLSGLAGAAFSAYFSDYSALGASGAIFGVVGANFYMLTKMNGETKKRFASDLITFVVLNIGFAALNSGIDQAAHIGGLIGGIISGFAFGHIDEKILSAKQLIRATAGIAAIAIIFFFVAWLKLSDPETYKIAIAYRYKYQSAEAAYVTAEDALSRHPDDAEIQMLYEELKYLNNLK